MTDYAVKLLDPPQPEPPEDVYLQPDERWHSQLGVVPDTWGTMECLRQIDLLKQRARDTEESRLAALERARQEAARVAALPPPPPTLEERVAELERQVAEMLPPKRRSRRAA